LVACGSEPHFSIGCNVFFRVTVTFWGGVLNGRKRNLFNEKADDEGVYHLREWSLPMGTKGTPQRWTALSSWAMSGLGEEKHLVYRFREK
jgi:hypothetical protein